MGELLVANMAEQTDQPPAAPDHPNVVQLISDHPDEEVTFSALLVETGQTNLELCYTLRRLLEDGLIRQTMPEDYTTAYTLTEAAQDAIEAADAPCNRSEP